MNQAISDAELELIAWSRVWSPIVPQELAQDAWDALGLPQNINPNHPTFVSTFIAGHPNPKVSLLFHAALSQDGGVTREAMVRIMDYLHLQWQDIPMPPDHVAVACEMLALAIQRRESVLVSEMLQRYFLPWCEFAQQQVIEINEAKLVVDQFCATLKTAVQSSSGSPLCNSN